MPMIQTPAPTLSLTRFEFDPGSRTILISGRASGLIGFLLHLMGVSPTTTFSLLFDRIELSEAKLSSESRKFFPLAMTESTAGGYRRSFGHLITGFVFLFFGFNILLAGAAIAGAVLLLFAAGFFTAFFFTRKLFIEAHCGSQTITVVFNEGTVDGNKIGREIVMNVIAILNNRIAEAQVK